MKLCFVNFFFLLLYKGKHQITSYNSSHQFSVIFVCINDNYFTKSESCCLEISKSVSHYMGHTLSACCDPAMNFICYSYLLTEEAYYTVF